MLHALQSLFETASLSALAPAMAERLTLVFNHVLASEAVATDRLKPHAGRSMRLVLEAWPSLLPAPPVLAWRITPAGLLEWDGAALTDNQPAPDLLVRLDASNPAALIARTLAGTPPPVQIEGDAQLAGDVNWLTQNLRWDVAADLHRLFGPMAAQQLQQLGTGLAAAMRAAVKAGADLGGRWRSRGA
jgi:ubiquinone biosynthesis accessory factor UbiJ